MTNVKKSAGASEMEKLLAKDNQPTLPKVGDLIKGKVISVSKSVVHLDINGVATGIVRGKELIDESGEYSDLKINNEAQATVLELENENGEMELSFRSAGHQKAWNDLQKMMEEEAVVDIVVTEANRGGLMIKLGRIEGFMPVSQLIPEHYPRVEGGDKNRILEMLQKLIGKKLKAKIIDIDESENKLIVSEKAAWENKQKAAISSYKENDIVEGRVTGVVDFGAFIEFGKGLEGLIHISELAWQRIDNPRDIIKVGDKIKAKIISIEGTKISLSMKQLMDDPWTKVVSKYKIGQKIKGTVIKLNPFGVFVELDKDIHGLVHISELSDKKINHPSEVVKEGERYELTILSIEPKNHRLGLSLKSGKVKTAAKEETEEKTKKSPKGGSAPGGNEEEKTAKKEPKTTKKDKSKETKTKEKEEKEKEKSTSAEATADKKEGRK